MPYRRQAIVLLVLLAVVIYAGKSWREQDEPRFKLTPEMIEAIQDTTFDPGLYEGIERLRERDPATLEPITVDPPPLGPPAPPTSAPRYVDVTVDQSGRPYDRALRKGGSIDRRPLVVLHAPTRRVLFLGGEHVPWVWPGEIEPLVLAERPGRRYRVDAIWLKEPLRKKVYEDIVGVVIVERDTPVARWRELEDFGYGTDAGLGAITTVEWAARAEVHPRVAQRLSKRLENMRRLYLVAGVDGHRGPDTLVFSNGFGDGGFPAVAGYDAAGRRAQVVLWTIVAPWRLAFPEGEPPSQVTKREDALADCLAGDRRIDGARCRLAPR